MALRLRDNQENLNKSFILMRIAIDKITLQMSWMLKCLMVNSCLMKTLSL